MSDLIALVADGNTSAARRARVRLQPRDDKGRWVITGAALSAGLRTNTGAGVRVTGKAIGGTATAKGQKNNIRMLADAGFEEYGITPGTVLTVDPKNATLESKVKLNRDFLESKGIDPDLQHTLPKTLDRQPQTLAEMDPQPADDLDIELANGGLTDEEDKDFRAERDAEPLAKLPPALAEDVAEGQEVRDIVEEAAAKPTKPYKVSFTDNGYTATNDHGKVIAWGTSQKKLDSADIARTLKELEDYKLPTKEAVEGFDFPEGYVGADRGRGGFEAYQLDDNGKAVPGSLVEVNDDTDFDWDNEQMWSVGDPMGNAVYLDPDLYSFRTSDRDEAIARAADLARKLTGTPSKEGTDNQGGLSDELLEKAAALEEKFDLVNKARGPKNKGMRAAPDLKPGDVIVDPNGNNWTVTDKPKVSALDNAKVDIKLKNDQGQTTTTTAAMTKNFPLATPTPAAKAPAAPAAKAPAAPAVPANKPAPAAPAAPATPAPKPVSPPKPKPSTTTTKPPASTPKPPPVIPAGREDKGQDVPPNLTPLRDMQQVKVANLIDPTTGKPVPGATRGTFVQDPNAIYNALLENNPQAVVNKNGHIVVERQSFTDNDGRVWKYQITVERTHNNKYMERYTFTDDKGEVKDFYHYDYKDSFAAIYGDKNGVYVFRDQLLGKSIPGKQPPTRNTLNYFGPKKTLNDRVRFFRGMTREGFEPTLEDLNKTSFKLLTPKEVVNKYSVGRAQKENKSGKARGTVLQSFVPSIFEAVETDDPNLFEGRLLQLLGHLPDDEDSRNLLVNSLRDGLKQKFNGTPLGRKVAPLANNIEKKILTEGFDLRDISRRPYSSRDGKTIVEPGNKVRYWNNVGDWSIGEVISQLPPVQSSGGKNSYDDVVAVKFKDGKIHLLRSNRMDILGDELDLDLNLHDKDSELSDYKRNLAGKALRDTRGYTYTFGDKERRADDNDGAEPDDVVNTADLDAAAPYLGEEGVSAEEAEAEGAEAPAEGNIGNFEAGDVWPDEDGDRMGTFVEAQKVSDPETGVQAWAVIWLDDDGDEQLEIIPIDSSRSPK